MFLIKKETDRGNLMQNVIAMYSLFNHLDTNNFSHLSRNFLLSQSKIVMLKWWNTVVFPSGSRKQPLPSCMFLLILVSLIVFLIHVYCYLSLNAALSDDYLVLIKNAAHSPSINGYYIPLEHTCQDRLAWKHFHSSHYSASEITYYLYYYDLDQRHDWIIGK